ncbi:hypothetical protein [Roseateles sp. YR242]|uniref:hypothetical protein n=1 Tax=Roseateles sp. YR242 TaxID=1855305 RepID=UPI001160A6F5|nr:hypothetical protein [Roseateles sp. YR242]
MFAISSGAGALASISEDDPASDTHATAASPALAPPSLPVEIRQWAATWQDRAQACARAALRQQPLEAAMQNWYAHLAQFTEMVRERCEAGDGNAGKMIADFPAISESGYRILKRGNMPGAIHFVNARTALMQRLIRNEFAAELQDMMRTKNGHALREFNRTTTRLCSCDDAGYGNQLLKQAKQQLHIQDPTSRPGPPPRPPTHPSRGEPAPRAHR